MMKLLGWFLLVVGTAIAGLWIVLLSTGQVPEVDEDRVDIWFHIAAELATAALLVAAGVMVLRRRPSGRTVAAFALGALAYTSVNSPGYYAESGDHAMVALFGLLTLVVILVAILLVRADRAATAADATPATDPTAGSGAIG
jgi:peptidoglycan/LPS O-acetylase OafA/YrhL